MPRLRLGIVARRVSVETPSILRMVERRVCIVLILRPSNRVTWPFIAASSVGTREPTHVWIAASSVGTREPGVV